MSGENEKETKVFVKGKLVPLKDLEEEYPQITLSGTPGNVRVMEILTTAEKPLSRLEIARSAGLTSGYTRDVLKKLMKNRYVLEFQLSGRIYYYLLTEKGLKLSKEIKK